MRLSRKAALSLLFSMVLIIDIVSKKLVQSYLLLHESVNVVPGFFNITYILNPGAAFGMLRNQPAMFRTVFFTAVGLMACVLLVVLIIREYRYVRRCIAYTLILAGAVGNQIDRIRIDKVVDFLDFYIGSHHWYTFNMADAAITTGVGLLILDLILKPHK